MRFARQCSVLGVIGMGCVGWWIFSSIINFDVNSLLNVRTWSICLTSKLDTLLDPLRIRRLPKDKLLNLALDLYSKDLEKNELSVKCAELKLENVRLRELLGLKPPSKHKVVYAEVIRRDASAWWDRLWINKGKADGLSIGDGVGYIGGIGGKISEIFETKAVVELLTSPNFRIAVQLAGDSRPFIYCGTKHVRFKRVGKLSDLPQDLFDIKETKVVSSEMSSKFPGNLFVGRLTKKIHGNGIYFDAECEIPNSLKDLREVMIFVNPK